MEENRFMVLELHVHGKAAFYTRPWRFRDLPLVGSHILVPLIDLPAGYIVFIKRILYDPRYNSVAIELDYVSAGSLRATPDEINKFYNDNGWIPR